MSGISGKVRILNRCKHVGFKVVVERKGWEDDVEISERICVLNFTLRF